MSRVKNERSVLASKDPGFVSRFWSKVDQTKGDAECHEWRRARMPSGYGVVNLPGGGSVLAHRMAYLIVNGALQDGMHCLHSCDNPPCCNPKHLWSGSQADNLADMTEKERRAKGIINGRAKLTEAEVLSIRALNGTMTQAMVADRYSVTRTLVSLIQNRKIWRHLP